MEHNCSHGQGAQQTPPAETLTNHQKNSGQRHFLFVLSLAINCYLPQ